MLRFLIVLAGLGGLFAALAGLLYGATFTSVELSPHPTLAKLLDWATRNRPLLFCVVIIGVVVSYGATTLKDWLSVQPAIALSEDPGEELPKATAYGFNQEIKEMAAELAKEATDYFESAERDYAAKRYRDATTAYQKSIDVLSTMSAYLNLGNASYQISDFQGAEAAFLLGLKPARQRQKTEFEAALRNGIGLVYREQGKLEDALASHQEALKLYGKIANPSGEASVLNNVGLVYLNQGKLEQALASHQAALKLHHEMGNPLGEASALNNLGFVYRERGQQEDALASHQAALELYRQIGNPQGEADALANIGLTYANQGKREEALDLLETARDIYLSHGLETEDLRKVELMLGRLRSWRCEVKRVGFGAAPPFMGSGTTGVATIL